MCKVGEGGGSQLTISNTCSERYTSNVVKIELFLKLPFI